MRLRAIQPGSFNDWAAPMIKLARTWTISAAFAAIPLAAAMPVKAAEQDVHHDFDFQFGTWNTHVSRLVHPLTGSTTWTEYEDGGKTWEANWIMTFTRT
jgi:hypothetical protein